MASTYYQTLSLLDSTGETSTVTVFHDEVTVANLIPMGIRMHAWSDAVGAQCFGNVDKELAVLQANDKAIAKPTNNYAQRENKLRIVYKSGDPTKNKLYQIEVPCVDLAKIKLLPKGKKGGPDPVAFKATENATAQTIDLIAKFVDLAVNPDDPNDGKNATNATALIVESVWFVSRGI